jgi:tetratricopeptide (TPR) repeat protein
LIAFGIFFFFTTIAAETVVIRIVDVMFEHRVYLPSVGFLIAVVAASEVAIGRWGRQAAWVPRGVVSLMIAAILALSLATYARNEVWRDGVKLWENAVAGSPGKARPRYYLGLAYAAKGRIGEAIEEYRKSLAIKPDYADVHYGLGYAYANQGRFDEAIEEYRAFLKLRPDFAPVRNNLAVLYMNQGRNEDAIREFQILLELSPDGYPMTPKFLEYLQRK